MLRRVICNIKTQRTMKEIIEKLKRCLATGMEPKLSPSEVKKILEAFKENQQLFCDTCEYPKMEGWLTCKNKLSPLSDDLPVDETTSCIHHSERSKKC